MNNEQQTRREIIDRRLAEAGWAVSDPTQVTLELAIAVDIGGIAAELPTLYQSQQFSDYALLGKDGKPLAGVWEANSPANSFQRAR